MIEEDYVSFETAKLLKEKGFKGQGEHFYEDDKIAYFIDYWHRITPEQRYETIEAPTLQMAMKWLREIHRLIVVIQKEIYTGSGNWWYRIDRSDRPFIDSIESDANYESYELAAEAAIKYCLENLN